eukprot:461573-Hanusia_phi.AAC.4
MQGNPGAAELQTSTVFRQCILLFRKQAILKRRSWKLTLLEILFPLYVIVLLVIIKAINFIPYEVKSHPPSFFAR